MDNMISVDSNITCVILDSINWTQVYVISRTLLFSLSMLM